MTDYGVLVADANVYVDAISYDGLDVLGDPPSLRRVPSLPPRRVHPALHVLGVVRDGSDTGVGPALAVSDHILLMVVRALRRDGRFDLATIRAFAYAIRDLAERSTGGYHVNVPATQADFADPEDNKILDLAVAVDADIIVTNDSDLLRLGGPGGWKGRAIITPEAFTARADGAARTRRYGATRQFGPEIVTARVGTRPRKYDLARAWDALAAMREHEPIDMAMAIAIIREGRDHGLNAGEYPR